MLYTYETIDFWEQIKTPGLKTTFMFFFVFPVGGSFDNPFCFLCVFRMSLKCSALYLSQFRHTSPHLLAGGSDTRCATVVGDVYIHPSAKVHVTAKVVFHLILAFYAWQHSLSLTIPVEFVNNYMYGYIICDPFLEH